jgi:hypothetical protein
MYNNYDEEVNQYIDEHDIDIKSNKKNNDSEIQNEYIDYEKFNLPLTMESKNYDFNKLINEYSTFDNSLYQDLEDKWLEIEKNKNRTLKRINKLNDENYYSINFSLNNLKNWKKRVFESRQNCFERKFRENENNDFDKFVNRKINNIKNLTISNKEENNIRNKIRNYFKRNKKYYNNNHLNSSNTNSSNQEMKSFLKEDEEEDKKIDNFKNLKNNQIKIPLLDEKENKVNLKIKNVYDTIVKNKNLSNNTLSQSKYSIMSIDDLDKNFNDIMSDLSNDYKKKSQKSLSKRIRKDNLNNNLYPYKMKSINKKYVENKMLLNDMLPESGIGNKKLSNIKNNNLSVSFFNNKNNPIRISSLIYGKNNFDSITNKFSEITSPKITRIINN